MKKLCIILLVCVGLATVGCGKNKNETRPTEYDGRQSAAALVDYAQRLEEMGDIEAAARVRALLDKASLGEAQGKAADTPAGKLVNGMDEADKIGAALK